MASLTYGLSFWLALGLGWLLVLLALCGAGYAVAAAFLLARFLRRPAPPEPGAPQPVTILKPLHRDEPCLRENLESFFVQDYAGPVQLVFGVHDAQDSALAVVRALQAQYPACDAVIVADPALYGANAKVSNLINMLPAARHDILVLCDSDIRVPANWLQAVTGTLARPGVGLVTCLYQGAAARKGLWPVLAAMGTSYDFLPNVVLGVSLGLAKPCMGSTIALTRIVLEEIGGFAKFADYLADDYEMGRAVRRLGLGVAIPALGVIHTAAEASVGELFRHELRWTRTIRLVNPAGHLGSVITFAVPLALIAAILLNFSGPGLMALAIALGARLFLKYRIDGIFRTRAGPVWLLPVRDILGFAVFVTSLFGETVHWRGVRFSVESDGVMSQSEVRGFSQ